MVRIAGIGFNGKGRPGVEHNFPFSKAYTFYGRRQLDDLSAGFVFSVSSNELNLKLNRLAIIVKLVHQIKCRT